MISLVVRFLGLRKVVSVTGVLRVIGIRGLVNGLERVTTTVSVVCRCMVTLNGMWC